MLTLIEYLPNFMQGFKEIQVIMDTSQPFVDGIDTEVENFLLDLFILEATENGVAHYEKMLNITPEPTQSLEERRYEIFLKYNETLPYTYKKLIEILNSILGEENYKIDLSVENLTLSLELSLNKKNLLTTIQNTLERILPVNIEFTVSLIYNTWDDLRIYTWDELKSYTWTEVKESELNETNG